MNIVASANPIIPVSEVNYHYKRRFTNENDEKAWRLEQERERYIVPGNITEFTYKDISDLRSRLRAAKGLYDVQPLVPVSIIEPEYVPEEWEVKRVEILSKIVRHRASAEYSIFLKAIEDLYSERSLKYQRAKACLTEVNFADDSAKVYRANYCDIRGCPVCEIHQRRKKTKRIYDYLCKMLRKPTSVRHLVLSVPNIEPENMVAGFKDFRKKVNKFRRSKTFKHNIFKHLIEFEYSIAKNNSINLHAHMYFTGRFWDVYEIKKLWDRVTKGNNYVYIKEIIKREDHPDFSDPQRPVMKSEGDSFFQDVWRRGWYLSKTPVIMDVEILKEAIKTFHRKKTLMTGGFRKRGNNLIRKEK